MRITHALEKKKLLYTPKKHGTSSCNPSRGCHFVENKIFSKFMSFVKTNMYNFPHAE